MGGHSRAEQQRVPLSARVDRQHTHTKHAARTWPCGRHNSAAIIPQLSLNQQSLNQSSAALPRVFAAPAADTRALHVRGAWRRARNSLRAAP